MGKQRSLLIVLYYYYPYVSGLSIYTKRIAEGLAKRGYRVTILSSRHDSSLPKKEIINGVTVIRRPVIFKLGKGVIMPTIIADIIWQSMRHDYINPMLPMAEVGPALLFVPRRKIIVSYICDLYLGEKPLSRLITFLSFASMHLAMMRAKEVFALSHDYLDNSRMKKYSSKATGVYPIIDDKEFKPIKTKVDFLEKTLGINKDTKKIGFVGRIVYEKGIGYLLDSIQYISRNLENFKIIIVGDYEKIAGGSVKDELDLYVKKYPRQIVFTGYLDDTDLKSFYSSIDVLVLPSIDPLEAFGIVQVEAMLCGVPVVTSNLPGVREVVEKTGFGLISRVKDSKDIAKKVVEVLNNPSKYKPSRKAVVTAFNPEISLNKYTDRLI